MIDRFANGWRHVRRAAGWMLAATALGCGAPDESQIAASQASAARQSAAQPPTRAGGASPQADGPRGLIPRAVLFAPPDRFRGRLSPDGRKVSWLGEHEGALNIWAAPADREDAARPLTRFDSDLGLYWWMANNTHIIFIVPDGEGQRVHAVDVTTGAMADITPGGADVRAGFVGWSWNQPDDVVLVAYPADRSWGPQAYLVNAVTGEARLLDANPLGLEKLFVDHALQTRIGVKSRPDGGKSVYVRSDTHDWRPFLEVEPEDARTWTVLEFDGANRGVYVLDSTGADAAMLTRIDLETGEREVLGGQRGADVDRVLMHPTTFEAEAFRLDRLTPQWAPVTSSAASALGAIERTLDGSVEVLARTVDDARWILYDEADARPGRYHVFSPQTGALSLLFETHPGLSRYLLAPKTPAVIPTADGLELVAYLTLPAGADSNGDGRPERASPLVIRPSALYRWRHGFDPAEQWLADRGYAVLSLNVRGAWSLGKRFRAGAEDPLSDAAVGDILTGLQWALERGVTSPGRVAVGGAGVDAALALRALSEHPEAFACATAVDPPADVEALAKISKAQVLAAPDPETRARYESRLLGGGALVLAGDALVTVGAAEDPGAVERVREGLTRARSGGGDTTLLVFPSEGPQIESRSARAVLYAATEQFLAACLGGDMEPFTGLAGVRVDVESSAPGYEAFDSSGRALVPPPTPPASPAPPPLSERP